MWLTLQCRVNSFLLLPFFIVWLLLVLPCQCCHFIMVLLLCHRGGEWRRSRRSMSLTILHRLTTTPATEPSSSSNHMIWWEKRQQHQEGIMACHSCGLPPLSSSLFSSLGIAYFWKVSNRVQLGELIVKRDRGVRTWFLFYATVFSMGCGVEQKSKPNSTISLRN